MEGEYLLRLHNMNPVNQEIVRLNNFLQVVQVNYQDHLPDSNLGFLSTGNAIRKSLLKRRLNMFTKNRSLQKNGKTTICKIFFKENSKK